MKMIRIGAATVIALASLSLSAPVSSAPTSYRFHEWDRPSCGTRALAISDNGVVTGGLCEPDLGDGRNRAFSFRTGPGFGGLHRFIGVPTSFGQDYATGVDAKGHVVGYASEEGGTVYPPRAYVTEHRESFQILEELKASAAYGVSPGGVIIGALQDEERDPVQAFLRDRDGSIVRLGTLGGSSSIGRAVNDSRMAVGEAQLVGDASSHAFAWADATGMTDLGTLGGPASAALAVNAQGVAVGRCDLRPGLHHACRFHKGVVEDLGSLGAAGTRSVASGINDAGTIVGSSESPGGEQHAFVILDGILTDLNDLVTDLPAGYVLVEANAINQKGQIVGTAVYQLHQFRAFALTPTAVRP